MQGKYISIYTNLYRTTYIFWKKPCITFHCLKEKNKRKSGFVLGSKIYLAISGGVVRV